VQQISPEGRHEFLRAAPLQPDLVVYAGVVDESVDVTLLGRSLLDNTLAIAGRRQIRANYLGLAMLSPEFILQTLASRRVTIHNHRQGALLSACSADGCSYSFGAARYQYDFTFDLKVHGKRKAMRDSERLRKQCLAAKIEEPSIDGIVGPGDEGRFFRAKIQCECRDLFGLCHSADGL
jgi:hypothetical protein